MTGEEVVSVGHAVDAELFFGRSADVKVDVVLAEVIVTVFNSGSAFGAQIDERDVDVSELVVCGDMEQPHHLCAHVR